MLDDLEWTCKAKILAYFEVVVAPVVACSYQVKHLDSESSPRLLKGKRLVSSNICSVVLVKPIPYIGLHANTFSFFPNLVYTRDPLLNDL
jgi:hypothetical protein